MAYPERSMTLLPPRTPTWDFGDMIAHGYYAEYRPFYKAGYNDSISGTTYEGLWTAGGVHNWPAAAQQVEIVSSSAADDGDPVGTGARTVTMSYLTDAFVEKTHVFTLNGTTAVASGLDAADVYRINSLRVTTAGTGGVAAGTISIRHLDDTPIYTQIAVGETRARNLQYTVPVNRTLYIQEMFTASGNATADKAFARLILRAMYDDQTWAASTVMQAFAEIPVDNGSVTTHFPVPIRFPQGTDIEVVAVGASATTATAVFASVRGHLESVIGT